MAGGTINRLLYAVRLGKTNRCPAKIVYMTCVTMGAIITSEVIVGGGMVDEGQGENIWSARFVMAGGAGSGFGRAVGISIDAVRGVDLVGASASSYPQGHLASISDMAEHTLVAMDHANDRYVSNLIRIVTGSTIDRLRSIVRLGIADRCPAKIAHMTSVTMGAIASSGEVAGGGMVDEGNGVFDIALAGFVVTGDTGGGSGRPAWITIDAVRGVDFVGAGAAGYPQSFTAGRTDMAEHAFVAMDHSNYRYVRIVTWIVTGGTIDRLHTAVRLVVTY